jgi:hypothetical protein
MKLEPERDLCRFDSRPRRATLRKLVRESEHLGVGDRDCRSCEYDSCRASARIDLNSVLSWESMATA